MKTTIKFKVLTEQGKKKSMNVTYKDCPDFEESRRFCNFEAIPDSNLVRVVFSETREINDQEELVTSIEEQIDKWVSELDKSAWMYDNEVVIIFNWEVISYTGMKKVEETGEIQSSLIVVNEPVKKPLTDIENMKLFFEMNKDTLSEKFINDYIAVYATLSPNMKGIKWDKQMSITFGAIGIAAQGAITALDNISSYSKALDKVDWDKHRYTQASDINKHGTWDLDAIRIEAKIIQNNENSEDSTTLIL